MELILLLGGCIVGLSLGGFILVKVLGDMDASDTSYTMPLLWLTLLALIFGFGLSEGFKHMVQAELLRESPHRYAEWAYALIHAPLVFTLLFWIGFLLIGTSYYFLYFKNKVSTQATEQLRLSNLAKQTELKLLQQQLQPHFLFNTLNSIGALIDIAPEMAQGMLVNLSDFYRKTVHITQKEAFCVGDELALLDNYIAIEKVRFADRLTINMQVEEGCQSIIIPPLMIQPLVENAIKFSLNDLLEKVTIMVSMQRSAQALVVTVSNPFDAKNLKQHSGTGFGLNALQRRLALLYNRTDLVKQLVNNAEFTVVVSIPISMI